MKITSDIPDIDMMLISYCNMSKLSKELQDKIRKELGII